MVIDFYKEGGYRVFVKIESVIIYNKIEMAQVQTPLLIANDESANLGN